MESMGTRPAILLGARCRLQMSLRDSHSRAQMVALTLSLRVLAASVQLQVAPTISLAGEEGDLRVNN